MSDSVGGTETEKWSEGLRKITEEHPIQSRPRRSARSQQTYGFARRANGWAGDDLMEKQESDGLYGLGVDICEGNKQVRGMVQTTAATMEGTQILRSRG